MKRILFITSQYRTGERIYPILPILAAEYKIDLLKVYQMTNKHKWVGNKDMRLKFDKDYLHLFDSIFENTCYQLSFDYVAWKNKLDFVYLPGDGRGDGIITHTNHSGKKWNEYYS